ncbi:MAG: Holliday junction branch migration protein RuvA [Rickettsiales bacterium]|nr:Holliday junction branch migration protein RuvA [Rickettsiales bacterium]|tara:strand:+ start:128 stop:736 length:609 start_codon:yes stop_codon:yes gene_type:complete
MIGSLKGRVEEIGPDHLVVDVNGVGYLVFTHPRMLSKTETGTAVALTIETHVREDHIHLYGFANKAERDWFRLLTTVQGVGAKVGLAILGMFTPDQLHTIIAAQDQKQMTAVNGVGPKVATRIVTELKGKSDALLSFTPVAQTGPIVAPAPGRSEGGATGDAVSALVNLGYGRSEAYTAVNKVADGTSDTGALIRLALKELA